MAPGVHPPVAVAIIDGFYWRAVRIGKVFVEICCTPQGFESRRVLRVFPVERYLRKGDVIVSGGWTIAAVFTPISVRCLLFGGETMQNPLPKIFPILVSEHTAEKQHKSGP